MKIVIFNKPQKQKKSNLLYFHFEANKTVNNFGIKFVLFIKEVKSDNTQVYLFLAYIIVFFIYSSKE